AWEFETAVRNNQNLGPNNRWALLDYGSSGSSGLPFIGGEPADPARAPGRPNAGRSPFPPYPPDCSITASTESRPNDGRRFINAASEQLKDIITMRLTARFVPSELRPTTSEMGLHPDDFVSSYVGYLAVWYQTSRSIICKIAFHTHVCFGISLGVCQEAFKIQLDETIINLRS
ncbi:MAG: hypothetical protein SFX74_08940, partial [Fimbriimonadaceae bacterium]|nr:hypothetical protein [Fimbriimonadaceae bacterium]